MVEVQWETAKSASGPCTAPSRSTNWHPRALKLLHQIDCEGDGNGGEHSEKATSLDTAATHQSLFNENIFWPGVICCAGLYSCIPCGPMHFPKIFLKAFLHQSSTLLLLGLLVLLSQSGQQPAACPGPL